MAKKTPTVEQQAVHPPADPTPSAPARRPSSLVDTRVIYCGDNLDQGCFLSSDFTEDAYAEIGAFFKRTGKTIRALTVKDILDESKLGMKLA